MTKKMKQTRKTLKAFETSKLKSCKIILEGTNNIKIIYKINLHFMNIDNDNNLDEQLKFYPIFDWTKKSKRQVILKGEIID